MGVSTLGNMLTLLWSQVRGVRSSCPASLLLLLLSLLYLWPCSSMSTRLTSSPLSCLCWSLLAGDRSEPEPASAPSAHCLRQRPISEVVVRAASNRRQPTRKMLSDGGRDNAGRGKIILNIIRVYFRFKEQPFILRKHYTMTIRC